MDAEETHIEPSKTATASRRRTTVIGIAVAVILVATICIAFAIENEHQNQIRKDAQDATVYELCDQYESNIEENTPDLDATTIDRAAVLADLTSLQALLGSIQDDHDFFYLSNGECYRFDDLTKSIEDHIDSIRAYIVENYGKSLESNSVADLSNGSITKDSLNSNITALQGLASTITAEKNRGIWESDDDCSHMLSKIQTEIDRQTARITELDAAQRAADAAEAAKNQATNSVSSSNNSNSYDSSDNSSYSSDSSDYSDSGSGSSSGSSSSSSSSSNGSSGSGSSGYDRWMTDQYGNVIWYNSSTGESSGGKNVNRYLG